MDKRKVTLQFEKTLRFMKSKRIFSEHEANQIIKLINQKLLASKNKQKTIRNNIRSFNFYFSDFSSKKGYTIQDFENLIKTGEIKIIGKGQLENKQINTLQQNVV